MLALHPSDLAKPAPARVRRPREHERVVVCGGGVAAVETVLALRSLLEVRPHIDLVAPNSHFVYQPLAVAEPFGLAETRRFPLDDFARDQRAELHVDTLAAVDAENRRVTLEGGGELPYDALVVALGARRRPWLDGALHFGGAESSSEFAQVLGRLTDGSIDRVAFVAPPGASWMLPLYELALLTAGRVADRHITGVELAVVTPEPEPLSAFGPAAERMLRNLLSDRGIALHAGSEVEAFADRCLRLRPERTVEADEVVALPRLEGRAVAGLPADDDGFVPVDELARVRGLEDVYAAGDGTNFPIKQGGIASQQADAAAETIAADLGAPVSPEPVPPLLRGMLLTGIAPQYLRSGVEDASERALSATALWWPPTKIAGRHLAPYLARPGLAGHEQLEDREAPASESDEREREQSHDDLRELAITFADGDAEAGDFESALHWLDVLEGLDGVLPPGYVDKRRQWEQHRRG